MNTDQESQSIDSLYDFLYVDTKRASTLIAQLYAPGVLTSLKRISSDSEKSIKSGGLDIKIAKGNLTVEDAINQTQEKLFDASWSLPINLLDKLSESDLILRGIEGQNLGKLVLTRGKIRFFDISFFQKSIPFVSQAFLNDIPAKNGHKKTKPDEVKLAPGLTFGMVKNLLDIIPNNLQVDFMDDNGNMIWMTISSENFTINPDDIALKYGRGVPGEWYALGLVDALPDHLYEEQNFYNFPENPLKDGLKSMLGSIQEMAGRPSQSYGMTPLLVFRTISKN